MDLHRATAPPTGSPHAPGNPVRGITFMVASTLMFCLADTFMKICSATLPTTETMFVRSLVAAILVFATAALTGDLRHWRK
ncbi:hypothetical protein ACSTH8_00460, partial [Vibrio parahaemolyticus]